MTACEWKDRIKAITRAAAAGDDAPLGILCDRLAAMEEAANAKRVSVSRPAPVTKLAKEVIPMFPESHPAKKELDHGKKESE